MPRPAVCILLQHSELHMTLFLRLAQEWKKSGGEPIASFKIVNYIQTSILPWDRRNEQL